MSKVSLLVRDDGENAHLSKTLNSIYAQTYTDLEILLFCSLSRECAVNEMIGSFSSNKNTHRRDIGFLVITDEPSSLSLYASAHKASGVWLLCLTAGGEIYPECIKKQVGFLVKHKHYSMVGCWYFIKDNDGNTVDVKKPDPFHIALSAQLIGSWKAKEMPALVKVSAIPPINKTSFFPYWFHMLRSNIGCLDEYLASIPEYLQVKYRDAKAIEIIKNEWNESRFSFLKDCEDMHVKRKLFKKVLTLFPHEKAISDMFRKSMESLPEEEQVEEDIFFANKISCIIPPQGEKQVYWNSVYGYYKKKSKRTLSLLCGLMSLREKPGQSTLLCEVAMQYLQTLSSRHKPVCLAKESGMPVSVIMPTFNRDKVIGETLSSLVKQEMKDFEVIIVNDGGSHNVEDIVRSFNDARFKYHWIPHVGRGGALNFGLGQAAGQYIAYTDDDDVFYPSHLAALYGAIKQSKARFAYTKNKTVKGYRRDCEFYGLKQLGTQTAPFDLERFYSGCMVSRLNAMHDRRLAEELGGFDAELEWGMEWDLWLLYCRHNTPQFVDEFTAEHRRTTVNMIEQNVSDEAFHTGILKPFFLSGYGLAVIALSAFENRQPELLKMCMPVLDEPSVIIGREYIERLIIQLDKKNAEFELMLQKLLNHNHS